MDIDIDLDVYDGLVDDIDHAELALRTAQADRLTAIYALHNALPTDRYSAACDAVIAEIATSLTISPRSASRLYDDADLICTRPALITALKAGRLDLARTKLIAVLLPTSDLQDRLQADAIDYGTSHTTHQLRRWLLSRLPDGDAAARKTAFEDRCLRITLDQRHADAVADLLDDRTTVTTTVNVVLPASGIGATVNDTPLPWSNAWELACRTNPTWFTWLGAPDARIINTTPGRYRIPTPLARTVRARDHHCRFPGCTIPAARCDLDHTVPFPDGPTTADNLHCLCRRHHRLKHHTGWTVVNLGNNELRWTSPAGRTYHTKPPDAFNHAA